MATFDQVFEKDVTFIFGSWVCTADGAGGWNQYLKPNKENKAEVLSIDDLVEKFGEMQLSDLVEGYEYESKMTQFQSISGSNYDPLAQGGNGHASACREATPNPNSDSDLDADETPLAGHMTALVIRSTPEGRYVYWRGKQPEELDNSHQISVLITSHNDSDLPFQFGKPFELDRTELVTPSSSCDYRSSLENLQNGLRCTEIDGKRQNEKSTTRGSHLGHHGCLRWHGSSARRREAEWSSVLSRGIDCFCRTTTGWTELPSWRS